MRKEAEVLVSGADSFVKCQSTTLSRPASMIQMNQMKKCNEMPCVG
jgi:hypothetical protein